jgi:hypothetical protein
MEEHGKIRHFWTLLTRQAKMGVRVHKLLH